MRRLNKALCTVLSLMLLLSLAVPALAADVRLSRQKLTVDGVEVDCEKYNIDGSNYFKLSDIAGLLSGTGSAFAVDWDEEQRTVLITTGRDYTPGGVELTAGEDDSPSSQVSSQTIVIDGESVDNLSVCNIGGNSYFRLRDLGEALGFEVFYDAAADTAIVKSVDPAAKEAYEAGNAAYEAEDYVTAAEWYGKAAELGYARAQTNSGVCYYYGNGVEQDYAVAAEWWTKAALQGDADAQFNLGQCYNIGEGVEQDYAAAAAEWWAKAASQGLVKAQYNLGICYFYGDGVEEDYAVAAEYMRKAAEQGLAEAQYNLGVCYEYGLGVSVDMDQAQYWYDLAAEQGMTGNT